MDQQKKKNTEQKLSKFNEKYQCIGPKSPANTKQAKHKDEAYES